MSFVLLIALWLLAIVCLVVGLAVVLPLRLELEVHKEAEWRIAAAIRPFGRIGPRIPFKAGRQRPKAEKTQEDKDRTKRHATLRNPRSLFPAAMRFVTDILGCIRVGKLTVNVHVGLGDPAMTGQAFGMLSPVMYGSPAIAGVEVRVVPVFDRSVVTGTADMSFSVVPIMLIGPFIRLGWHIFGPAR